MRALQLAAASVALVVVAGWNAVVTRVGEVPDDGTSDDPLVVEHERNWYDYLRGYHVHVGDGDGHLPEHGSLREGLVTWWETDCMRGYTRGNDVYLCPNAPTVVRVHQAGHAPAFGREFDPLRIERREDGALEDEPLRTLDVMLPAGFPHSLLRLRDRRGLGEAYERWVATGRLARR
ncbi:hypothetical protein [Halorarius litoreus]|uniref:hypothetical protein n=1 Tax=Halorarius litoreus TaxID=2962676 RepID=UPI0020CD6267|nr:hypothetical protein [Halorarius litoreus]